MLRNRVRRREPIFGMDLTEHLDRTGKKGILLSFFNYTKLQYLSSWNDAVKLLRNSELLLESTANAAFSQIFKDYGLNSIVEMNLT